MKATTDAAVGSPHHLLDPQFHATSDPHAVWRRMRDDAAVHWHEPGDLPGFWSLTRYEDVRHVYRNPHRFSSAHGVLLRPVALGEDPGGGYTLALTDPPRHRELRTVVAEYFSERAVRGLEAFIDETVHRLLAAAVAGGGADFVHDIAGRLSMHVIGHILGVPARDHDLLFHLTNEAFEAGASLAASRGFMTYFIDLMDRRAAEPTGDLMSELVAAMHDGVLSDEEVLLGCENLVGATENGRLAVAGGMLALVEHPTEMRRLREDPGLLPTAVEEILRWTSSATHSMRRATEPCTIGGHRIEAGDWVVLWVPSANRDERVFPKPDRFDVARTPNRHLALGSGEHFCLGGTLARAQLRLLYSALLRHTTAVELAGPVTRVASIAVGGPEHLPVTITGSSRTASADD